MTALLHCQVESFHLRLDEPTRERGIDRVFDLIDGEVGEPVLLDVVEHWPSFCLDDGQPQLLGVLGHIGFIASHEEETALEAVFQFGQGLWVCDLQRVQDELQGLKFPLKAGASWEIPMGKQINRFSVVGIEDVILERATYRRCIHLHSESNDGVIMDNWKAPGIGDIKSEMTNSTGAKESSSLVEFKTGK